MIKFFSFILDRNLAKAMATAQKIKFARPVINQSLSKP